jgi:hypothetical protein
MQDRTEIPVGISEESFLSLGDAPDFLEKPEAEIPVPDRLLPRGKSLVLWNRLKLSQQIGLLLFLNRKRALSSGGKERLLYLQEKASFEAISAGLKFAQRLENERKLQSDFKHQLLEANRRPQSKRFRKREARRIGVGYRDKGTLPEISSKGRNKAQEEAYLLLDDLPESISTVLERVFPDSVEGGWFDLSVLTELDSEQDREVSTFLNLL